MVDCDYKDATQQDTAAAQLVVLLHMGIDLVEDAEIQIEGLQKSLHESLLDSLKLALKWRHSEQDI